MYRHALTLALLLAQSCVAADFYFDSAATGSGNGLSWVNAFTSANSDNWTGVASGDTVWLKQGTHAQQLRLYNKTGITVKIDPEATAAAIFTAGGQFASATNCVVDGWLNNDQHIKIIGQVAGNAAYPAYWIRSGNNITVRGVEVDRTASYESDTVPVHLLSIQDSPTPPILIENCELHHTSGDGVNLNFSLADNGNFDRVTIRDTYIHDVIDDGVQVGLVWGVTVDGCTIDHGSTAWSGLWGHPDGLQMSGTGGGAAAAGKLKIVDSKIKGFTQDVFIEYASGSVLIYNNVFIGAYDSSYLAAIGGGGNGGLTPAAHATWIEGDDFIVVNNTFYNYTWGSAFKGGSTMSVVTEASGTALFDNNIMVNCKFGDNDNSLAALLTDTCIWYDEEGVQFYTSAGVPTAAPASRYMGSAQNIDPAFTNTATETFTLLATSGAINEGSDLSAWFTTDRAGTTRAAPWESGPYEYTDESEDPPAGGATIGTATAIAVNAITLTWTDGDTDEAGFKIERSLTTSTGFAQVGTAAADAETFTDRDLTPGVQYFYRLRPYNASGNGEYTAESNATTPAISGYSAPSRASGAGGLW